MIIRFIPQGFSIFIYISFRVVKIFRFVSVDANYSGVPSTRIYAFLLQKRQILVVRKRETLHHDAKLFAKYFTQHIEEEQIAITKLFNSNCTFLPKKKSVAASNN